jgi:Xaa-Pro aminopeptidase
MTRVRNQKTDAEIEKIKKACKLGDLAFEHILRELKIGITEKQTARLIKIFLKERGSGISFRPIVAFGKNTSEVHHKPTDIALRKNHGFIMIDLGAKLDGYCSDMTRTIFLGKVSSRQKLIYETVLEAQRKSKEFIEASMLTGRTINGSQVDMVARKFIIKQGFPNIPHSVGHGIGRKVHEGFRIGPKSKTIVKEAMVFSIEPGIYLAGYGGVRIEDLFTITKNGLQQLTHSPSQMHTL